MQQHPNAKLSSSSIFCREDKIRKSLLSPHYLFRLTLAPDRRKVYKTRRDKIVFFVKKPIADQSAENVEVQKSDSFYFLFRW